MERKGSMDELCINTIRTLSMDAVQHVAVFHASPVRRQGCKPQVRREQMKRIGSVWLGIASGLDNITKGRQALRESKNA